MSTGRTIADKHGIILPAVVVDTVLLQSSRQDLPGRIIQCNFETLVEILRALLSLRFGLGLIAIGFRGGYRRWAGLVE